jgi:hypothetical protein
VTPYHTMTPEMDAWLERQQAKQAQARALTSEGAKPATVLPVAEVPPCPLNDREFAWLWGKYQTLSFPPASAPKRLARCALERLTLRGRNFAVRMAFKFRRQIFGKAAAKWAQDGFLSAVRCAAAVKEVSP